MRTFTVLAIAAGAFTALASSPVSADATRHHRVQTTHRLRHAVKSAPHRHAAYGYRPYVYGRGPYGSTAADPYPPPTADDRNGSDAAPGAALRALARRNQEAPGVTNELAPDNKATASGGPVGGVPGFDGF